MFKRIVTGLLLLNPLGVLSQYLTAPGNYSHPCIVQDIQANPVPIWRNFPVAHECAPGFYCPNVNVSDSNTYASVCVTSVACQQTRLGFQYCSPQGLFEPSLCGLGKYCPTQYEQLDCPSGYFCPLGRHTPIECPALSFCPTGSHTRLYLGAFLWIFIVDVGLYLILYLYDYYQNVQVNELNKVLKGGSTTSHNNQNPSNGSNDEISIETISVEQKSDKKSHHAKLLQALRDGFERGRIDYIKSNYFKTSNNNNNNNQFTKQQVSDSFLNFTFNNLSVFIPNKNSNNSQVSSEDQLMIPINNKEPKGKVILSGVTGSIRSGKMTAIMGPSGAGKSTFLKRLLGKLDPEWVQGGTLSINDDSNRSVQDLKEIVGYVSQTDIMHNELTVYQNIKMACDVRAPRCWDNKTKEAHICNILQILGLDRVHSLVVGEETGGGLSGGQRKRLNIAMQLAAVPLALFLDEPTSGLDSTTALQVCEILKELAYYNNITVALVVHQPRVEIWNSLDELLLLAPGGLTVYQGPQKYCRDYFTDYLKATIKINENPSDALMDAIAENGEKYVQLWTNGGQDALINIINNYNAKNNNKTVEEKENNDIQDNRITFHDDHNNNETLIKINDPRPNSDALPLEFNNQNITVDSIIKKTVPPSTPAKSSEHTRGASFFTQFILFFYRALQQQASTRYDLSIELLIAAITGVIMGVTSSAPYQGVLIPPYSLVGAAPMEFIVPQTAMYNCMSIALTAASAGVQVFGGNQQTNYFKEAAEGFNRHAYFWGVTFAYFPRIFFVSIHFTFIYHIIAAPVISFGDTLVFVMALYFSIFGLSSIVSQLCSYQLQPLAATVGAVVLSVFNGFPPVPIFLKWISPMYWISDFYVGKQMEPFEDVMQVKDISVGIWDYHYHWFGIDVLIVILIGFAYRFIAHYLIITRYKDKQM